MNEKANSVGIVKPQYFTFAHPPGKMKLESGHEIGPVSICYETYGTLNKDKSNAILILHALSGDAHVAGYHSKDDAKPGWWDVMVGPEKPFDTNKYFIICSNFLGGCSGSTGPSSINPETKKPYGLTFPMITVSDMVKAQKALIDYLQIDRLLCVSGGSLGGMQVLQWPISYPEVVRSAIPIATTSRLSTQALAFNTVGRNAITSDPNWNNDESLTEKSPSLGLAIARMIGHITYLSPEAMHNKFGRKLRKDGNYNYDFSADFQIESYLNYQGARFIERFDATTYLYITKAMDYFDLAGKYGSLEDAFKKAISKFLVVSFSSDWLFPSYQSKEIVKALIYNDITVSSFEIKTDLGHDSFLLNDVHLGEAIRNFLDNL